MNHSDWDGLSVDEFMTRWPQTMRVFLDKRMLCPGCPIGGFHDLSDAADAHGISLEALRHEIANAIGNEQRKS